MDARGAVYVFHLRANRFSLAHKAGQEVTAITFSPGRENHIILGLEDHSGVLVCIDLQVGIFQETGTRKHICMYTHTHTKISHAFDIIQRCHMWHN